MLPQNNPCDAVAKHQAGEDHSEWDKWQNKARTAARIVEELLIVLLENT